MPQVNRNGPIVNRSIQFREDINQQLEAAAERMHVSINWLVNQLVDEALDRLAPEIRITASVE